MSTQNRDLAREHMSAFRQRRKNGLQPVSKPWEWLSLADELAQAFECLVNGAADGKGIARGPRARHYAACLREGVPADWRPQYPVYQKVIPASAANTPRMVINADEGNANEHDSRL